MAKKRLVDFRGGINLKISSHMIGDSQGQDATDTDLSTVRLQGRKKLDTTGTSPLDRAWGEHYYDAGASGRWVSSDTVHGDDTSAPANLVVTNASDFVTWNQDLYVSRVNASGGDTLVRYIDGGTTPYALAFEPPAKVDLTCDFYDYIYDPDSNTVYSDPGAEWSYDSFRELTRQASSDIAARSSARGVNWAVNRKFDSLSDSGYYLKTVRNFSGIPIESNTAVKANLTRGTFVEDVNNAPNFLNFSITAPSDNSDATVSAMPIIGYRLYRNDNISRNVSLGLIYPESISLTITQQAYYYEALRFFLTGLDSNGTYRAKWWCWSGGQFDVGFVDANNNSSSTLPVNLDGTTFNVNGSGHATLGFRTDPISNTDTTTLEQVDLPWVPWINAVDLWIEKEVLTGVWATVKCFSVYSQRAGTTQDFYHSYYPRYINQSNSPMPTTLTPNQEGYDFIDCFASGLSSGFITSNQEKTAPPNSMKFLKEWNNFFFGVGTQYTSSDRYGGNKNKADTFLFVSDYNNPRHWPLDGYLEFSQAITGIFPFRDSLIVFSKFAAYKVFGSRPNQMRKTQFSDTEGLIEGYEKTIQRVGNFLVWISQSGICVFDGAQVTNLTRGRFDGDPFDGTSPIVAGVFEGKYYAIRTNGSGFLIDFTLEGFPITKVNSIWDDASVTTPASPVLHYVAKTHQLFFGVLDTNDNTNKGGIVEGSSTRSSWTYKTRAFDGDNFGSIKLIRNFTINGSGYGTLTATVDGTTVLNAISVGSSGTPITEPTRVYLPETVAGNDFGLPAGDTWDLQLNWTGTIDWIDTEYDILAA
jgi:hypothetical protein